MSRTRVVILCVSLWESCLEAVIKGIQNFLSCFVDILQFHLISNSPVMDLIDKFLKLTPQFLGMVSVTVLSSTYFQRSDQLKSRSFIIHYQKKGFGSNTIF